MRVNTGSNCFFFFFRFLFFLYFSTQISPLQALHIPECGDKNVLVRLTYGENESKSFSVPYSPDMRWYQELESDYTDQSPETVSSNREFINNRNNLLTQKFRVDTLNIKGNLRVSVMAGSFPKSIELANLKLPIFNVLDSTCTLPEDTYYEKWFPLLKSKDSVPAEGEMGIFEQSAVAEQADPFGYERPCILLRLRWIPEMKSIQEKLDSQGQVANSKLYTRLQLPSLSASLVDSEHFRELIQLHALGVDLRHFETSPFTEYLVNVASMQV